MLYRLAADAVLLVHLAFVLFVVLGGALVLRWPRIAWAHVPAVIWGALIEFGGWICPLTPMEVTLRQAAGEAGYSGGFIEHYLLPVLYPEGLTHGVQLIFGAAVIAINAVVYAAAAVLRRSRKIHPFVR